MDFSKTLFRCSSLGHLMTEPKLKADKEAGNLSESAITHLIDIYVSEKYGRNTDLQNKYLTKGNLIEEDSITLYSLFKSEMFLKNEQHLSNDFIKGTPDIILKDKVIDIKSSWDIFTFFRNKVKSINKLYYWQLQGYMWLTNTNKATLVYCLTNTPESLIYDEKNRLRYKTGLNENSKEFTDACNEIDRLSYYDDIDIKERIIEFEFERNDSDIELINQKVTKAREFLNELS